MDPPLNYYCQDFTEADPCCGSCHYDEEDGYSDLLDVYDPVLNRVAHVCCNKTDYVKKLWRIEE